MTFKASAQYNDWKGTAALDDADERSIHKLLQERKLIGERDFVIGLDVWNGENHGGEVKPVSVTAYLLELRDGMNVPQTIEAAGGVVRPRAVRLDLTAREFLGLFKRMSLAISPSGLLDDVEVEPIEKD